MKGSDYKRIERAIHFLIENAETQPSLENLALFLGVSEFHCHRLFKKWAGITPKGFLQLITLSKARALLKKSRSLLDTTLSVGLSGTSRLHDLFITYEAMTPGEFKRGGAGLEIYWNTFEAPLGLMIVAMTNRGICTLQFIDNEKQGHDTLVETWPNAAFMHDPKKTKKAETEICARMLGKINSALKLHVKGTPFQVKVWEALLAIPEGKLTTYQKVASAVGAPRAVRAVGTAVGANPIGYLIPCHRVIKSTGVIGKYHWGVARKTALLAIECARCDQKCDQ